MFQEVITDVAILTMPSAHRAQSGRYRFGRTANRLIRPGPLATAVLLVASTSGCAVGPQFARPSAPEVTRYTSGDLLSATRSAEVVTGTSQQFILGADIPAQWWSVFRSAPLNRLIDLALRSNPNLQAAYATLRSTREVDLAERGLLIPAASFALSGTREKLAGETYGESIPSSLFSVSTASVNAMYFLDIFGGVRRRVESAAAREEWQRCQLAAAYLTLTSNVVVAAIAEASLRAQLAATQEISEAEAQQLSVLKQQVEVGGASGAAVLAEEAILAQTRTLVPGLQKQLLQTRFRLLMLAGRFPSEDPGFTFDLTALELPRELPVSLPSKLVEQRPDIRAAEAVLHQATAEVGVATANMLPQIALTATYGSAASSASDLFGPGTALWTLTGNLVQPLFNGGSLIHQRRAAVAALDAATDIYRQTVLGAFGQVANVLSAIQTDADALVAAVTAERAADNSLAVARGQYQAGAITYVALLSAEQTYQQTRIALVEAQASRLSDTAALFQALGGGWWNTNLNVVSK